MAKKVIETRVAGMLIKTEVDVPDEVVAKPAPKAATAPPKTPATEKKAKPSKDS